MTKSEGRDNPASAFPYSDARSDFGRTFFTSSIDNAISDLLPEGWSLTHLLTLGEGSWQANISDHEHVVIGTGDTITSAVLAAALNSQDDRQWKTKISVNGIHRWTDPNKVSLTDLLRLSEPSQPIRRL